MKEPLKGWTKVSIEEARKPQEGDHCILWRPERNLPEDQQYCLIRGGNVDKQGTDCGRAKAAQG